MCPVEKEYTRSWELRASPGNGWEGSIRYGSPGRRMEGEG